MIRVRAHVEYADDAAELVRDSLDLPRRGVETQGGAGMLSIRRAVIRESGDRERSDQRGETAHETFCVHRIDVDAGMVNRESSVKTDAHCVYVGVRGVDDVEDDRFSSGVSLCGRRSVACPHDYAIADLDTQGGVGGRRCAIH